VLGVIEWVISFEMLDKGNKCEYSNSKYYQVTTITLMRTTQIMTVSLPPAMVRQCEEVRKRESRTRSELVREALRTYFESRYPAVEPTKAELAALRRGRAAFRREDSVSLKNFLNELAPRTHGTRAKRLPKASAKRSGTR
jgi:Arc/MetJ-type ribon-helix-helix transcriptional regulator